MSATIVLLPWMIAAIATGAATSAAGAAGVTAGLANLADGSAALQVRTRMKDIGLLRAALEDLGAEEIEAGDDHVRARAGELELEMRRAEDGVWTAHVSRPGVAEPEQDRVVALLTDLDRAYASRVQAAVADRIRQRAGAAGLDLVSESVDEEQTVTMLLDVRDGS